MTKIKITENMEEKKRKSIPFGKKLRVRNFVVLKYVKSMRACDLKTLRKNEGIPDDVQKHLQRGGLPYIKVSSLAEDWSVEFVMGSRMYLFIDSRPTLEEKDLGTIFSEDSVNVLHNLFVMMYADCTILGDAKYSEGKGMLLKEYISRMACTPLSKEEDDKILAEVKAEEEEKANIADMAAEIRKQEEKGGNNVR